MEINSIYYYMPKTINTQNKHVSECMIYLIFNFFSVPNGGPWVLLSFFYWFWSILIIESTAAKISSTFYNVELDFVVKSKIVYLENFFIVQSFIP